ncbi:MAG: phage baseplate protein [Anaerolineales bacterium]|nr:phage baseplate protein [Anaerolineales bacterium]
MRVLEPSTMLDLWEAGRAQMPFARADLLLHALYPDADADALLAIPIGRRDGVLLRLRAGLFGPTIHGVVGCPHCSAPLEMDLETDTLLGLETAPALDLPRRLTVGDYTLELRLLTTRDLIATMNLAPAERAAALFTRCIVTASYGSEIVQATTLPQPVVSAVANEMATLDTLADVQFALTCPECGNQWRAAFDIVDLLWRELEHWAKRILHEVHVLASAYSWHEAEILALSPWRRAHYLGLIVEQVQS